MGMDIYGIKPATEEGNYFRANVWSWRPIHYLCDYLNVSKNLGFDLSRWGYNDGAGLDAKQSKILAKKLDQYLDKHPHLKEDDDRMYICMYSWCTPDGQSVKPHKISEDYPDGTVLYSSVVSRSGQLVQPSYSVTLGHIKQFITFLNSCGGFNIH